MFAKICKDSVAAGKCAVGMTDRCRGGIALKIDFLLYNDDGQVDERDQIGVSVDVCGYIVICSDSKGQVEAMLEGWGYTLDGRGIKK